MKNKSDNSCVLENDLFQNVYVELKDGTVGMFSGPVLFQGDPNNLVKSISFSPPKRMPESLTWSKLWNEEVV